MGARRNADPPVRPGAVIAAICGYLIVCVAIGAISHRAPPWLAPSAGAAGDAAGPP